jgi:pimeloyl-ACP methyl ester carboxylesterase
MRMSPPTARATRTAATVITLALLATACTAAARAASPGAARPSRAHRCPPVPGPPDHLLVPRRAAGRVRKVPARRGSRSRRRQLRARLGTLLFLTGGPGQPGVQFTGPVAHELRPALRAYRLVMIDQRGTGGGA